MSQRDGDDEAGAYAARDIAQAIARDRELMRIYKEAGREQRVQAISSGNRHYVLVTDARVLAALRRLKPAPREHGYDPATGEVRR